MKPPNILYLHSHDTGRYVQPYGHSIPTPNIQRLAEEGVLFRQAFCAAPTCSPSRAALLTGQSAHSSGMIGLAHRGFSMKDYGQHLLHSLREAGYPSTLVGVQHIATDSKVIGYDEVLSTRSNRAEDVAPRAAEYLEDGPSQPFFLSVGFGETHREFPEPDSEGDAKYSLPPFPIPDTPETRRDFAGFKASARRLDSGIGLVLDALSSSGLSDNTLVICTTDHGIAFPYMKCNLTDHGIGVMLILRGPAGFLGGKVIDRSLMPLIRGEVEEVNDEIFAEVTFHAAYEPQRAVRTKRWKYIRRFTDRTSPVLPNCDDSLSKEVWMRNGWAGREVEKEQLYDLVFDPNETHNLARATWAKDVLSQMRVRLETWMLRTHDPLLEGTVAPPSGALVNDPDGTSPKGPRHRIP